MLITWIMSTSECTQMEGMEARRKPSGQAKQAVITKCRQDVQCRVAQARWELESLYDVSTAKNAIQELHERERACGQCARRLRFSPSEATTHRNLAQEYASSAAHLQAALTAALNEIDSAISKCV